MSNDTFFKHYQNTNLNFIPLISATEKKVYLLTGPSVNGVVIFGNDYLLTFNDDYNLISKKRLHQNIISIKTDPKNDSGKGVIATMHTHLPETGDFITATDICTLLLYERFTTWQWHYVYSANYQSMWNCNDNYLTTITLADNEKQKKKQGKK